MRGIMTSATIYPLLANSCTMNAWGKSHSMKERLPSPVSSNPTQEIPSISLFQLNLDSLLRTSFICQPVKWGIFTLQVAPEFSGPVSSPLPLSGHYSFPLWLVFCTLKLVLHSLCRSSPDF